MDNEWINRAISDPANAERVLIKRLGNGGEASTTHTYAEIDLKTASLAQHLRQDLGLEAGTRVGLVAKNSELWVTGDLALLRSGIVEVPIPLSFSAEQARHLLSHCDYCLVDRQGLERLNRWDLGSEVKIIDIDVETSRLEPSDSIMTFPENTEKPAGFVSKVIHTSGTTGAPKGVQVSMQGLSEVVHSVDELAAEEAFQDYFSTVPLSLLIEQILAIYLPLVRGGRITFLDEGTSEIGMSGAEPRKVLEIFLESDSNTVFLPPALVDLLDESAKRDHAMRDRLKGRTLLTGGAPVSAVTLQSLRDHEIEVLEGYGLSENSSVVAWNAPGRTKIGTVGRPLSHCEVQTNDSGELMVRSSSLLVGYEALDPTSLPVDEEGWLHTGDLADIDGEGYVTIRGRKRNMIITSIGRNVSPEYVESNLRRAPGVSDVVVFGNGLPRVIAVVFVVPEAEVTASDLEEFAIANLSFTDQPERFRILPDSSQIRANYFTVTGRARREDIWRDLAADWLQPDTTTSN